MHLPQLRNATACVFDLQGQEVAGAIETVLIPVVREGSLKARTTLCVSSQVGCAMNCQFCFTGRMGLRYSSHQHPELTPMLCLHKDTYMRPTRKLSGQGLEEALCFLMTDLFDSLMVCIALLEGH